MKRNQNYNPFHTQEMIYRDLKEQCKKIEQERDHFRELCVDFLMNLRLESGELKPTDTLNDKGLLPCPFCGEKEVYITKDIFKENTDHEYTMYCGYCPSCTKTITLSADNEKEAEKEWNTRTSLDAKAEGGK